MKKVLNKTLVEPEAQLTVVAEQVCTFVIVLPPHTQVDSAEVGNVEPALDFKLQLSYTADPIAQTDTAEMYRLMEELAQKQQQILAILETLRLYQFQNDELMDNNDVCKFLKVSERTIYRWRSEGKLQAILIGGKHYYSKRAIVALFTK